MRARSHQRSEVARHGHGKEPHGDGARFRCRVCVALAFASFVRLGLRKVGWVVKGGGRERERLEDRITRTFLRHRNVPAFPTLPQRNSSTGFPRMSQKFAHHRMPFLGGGGCAQGFLSFSLIEK